MTPVAVKRAETSKHVFGVSSLRYRDAVVGLMNFKTEEVSADTHVDAFELDDTVSTTSNQDVIDVKGDDEPSPRKTHRSKAAWM